MRGHSYFVKNLHGNQRKEEKKRNKKKKDPIPSNIYTRHIKKKKAQKKHQMPPRKMIFGHERNCTHRHITSEFLHMLAHTINDFFLITC